MSNSKNRWKSKLSAAALAGAAMLAGEHTAHAQNQQPTTQQQQRSTSSTASKSPIPANLRKWVSTTDGTPNGIRVYTPALTQLSISLGQAYAFSKAGVMNQKQSDVFQKYLKIFNQSMEIIDPSYKNIMDRGFNEAAQRFDKSAMNARASLDRSRTDADYNSVTATVNFQMGHLFALEQKEEFDRRFDEATGFDPIVVDQRGSQTQQSPDAADVMTFTTQANKIINFKKTHRDYFPVTKEVVQKYGNDGLQLLRKTYNNWIDEYGLVKVSDGTNQEKYEDLMKDFFSNIDVYKSYINSSSQSSQPPAEFVQNIKSAPEYAGLNNDVISNMYRTIQNTVIERNALNFRSISSAMGELNAYHMAGMLTPQQKSQYSNMLENYKFVRDILTDYAKGNDGTLANLYRTTKYFDEKSYQTSSDLLKNKTRVVTNMNNVDSAISSLSDAISTRLNSIFVEYSEYSKQTLKYEKEHPEVKDTPTWKGSEAVVKDVVQRINQKSVSPNYNNGYAPYDQLKSFITPELEPFARVVGNGRIGYISPTQPAVNMSESVGMLKPYYDAKLLNQDQINFLARYLKILTDINHLEPDRSKSGILSGLNSGIRLSEKYVNYLKSSGKNDQRKITDIMQTVERMANPGSSAPVTSGGVTSGGSEYRNNTQAPAQNRTQTQSSVESQSSSGGANTNKFMSDIRNKIQNDVQQAMTYAARPHDADQVANFRKQLDDRVGDYLKQINDAKNNDLIAAGQADALRAETVKLSDVAASARSTGSTPQTKPSTNQEPRANQSPRAPAPTQNFF